MKFILAIAFLLISVLSFVFSYGFTYHKISDAILPTVEQTWAKHSSSR